MIASNAQNSKFSPLSKFQIITDVGDTWQDSFIIEGTIFTAAAQQHVTATYVKRKNKK
jgi:hypothetical protein